MQSAFEPGEPVHSASALRSVARRLKRIILPEARAIDRLERTAPDQLLQPSPFTKLNRHPALFRFAAERLAGVGEPRLLSFGCSTGEEPITLSRYLPRAAIDAIDINPRSLAKARAKARRAGCDKIAFHLASEPPSGPMQYDAVFCLSVLRHGTLDAERPASSAGIFPFVRFDAVVAKLDRTLKPGGVLYIWASNYRFTDCALAHRYRPLQIPGMRSHSGTFYGSDNRLLALDNWPWFAFEKLC